MGESFACLAPSFSFSSPTSCEEKKGNIALQRALTASVSFGRFMSEPLDWEKWSAFSHNRYLEEAERYSKPGAVAEKKAYFEAHFKRRRAAALLEQQNVAACSLPETNEEANVQENSCGTDVDIQNSDPLPSLVGQNASDDASVVTKSETRPSGEIEEVSEPPVAMEILRVELTKNLENDECSGGVESRMEDKVCDEDDSDKRNSSSLNEKKSEVSCSSKLSTCGGVSEFAPPVKQIMPSEIRKSVRTLTPNGKKIDMELSNKRRSYITSLHMSMDFATSSQTAKSPGLPKVVVNSRPVRAPAKKFKSSTFPQTSTRASVSVESNHHSVAPPAENRRTVTPQGDSNSLRKTVDRKVHSQSSDFSKSSNTCEGKARLATTSSPFTFKSEERAAKRKEFFQKLEQKSTSKETEKHGQQVKSQVKARSSFKDIRSSIAPNATENTEVPPRINVSSNLKKKILTERQCFPKIEERSPFKVQDNDSRPPRILSAKSEGKDVAGQNLRPPGKCFSKKTNENASRNHYPGLKQ